MILPKLLLKSVNGTVDDQGGKSFETGLKTKGICFPLSVGVLPVWLPHFKAGDSVEFPCVVSQDSIPVCQGCGRDQQIMSANSLA